MYFSNFLISFIPIVDPCILSSSENSDIDALNEFYYPYICTNNKTEQ